MDNLFTKINDRIKSSEGKDSAAYKAYVDFSAIMMEEFDRLNKEVKS